MTLAELGAQLREERVSLGLTVEDVAIRLKIPARILRAIEDGAVGDLPHTVYTRGFIKGYGLILGYTGDAITDMLDSLEDVTEDFSPPKTLEPQAEMDGLPIGAGRRGFGLVLKLLVIALLGAGGYMYYTHTYRDGGASDPSSASSPVAESAGRSSAASPEASSGSTADWQPPTESGSATESSLAAGASSTSSAPAAPASPASSGATPSSGVAAPNMPATAPGATSGSMSAMPAMPAMSAMSSVPAAGAPASPMSNGAGQTNGSIAATMGTTQSSEADPVKPRGIETLAAPGMEQAVAAESSPKPEAALPAGMHQIVLTAEAECWVHANADGTDTRQFSLKAGETFAMPFKKSMVLKLGNAGGVKIKYDGEEMAAAGASGQVKTITFPPKAE